MTPEVIRRVADGFATGICICVFVWVLSELFSKRNTAKLLEHPQWGNLGAAIIVASVLLAALFSFGMT